MTIPDRPSLRVSSAADMLAAIPHLIGFHPADSLVVVAIAASKVALACRVDLPAGPVTLIELLSAIRQVDGTHLVIVGYGPDDLVAPTVTAACLVFTSAGLQVHDALRVADGRYWSYLCENPACCPPEGTPFDAVTNPLALHAVVAGSSPFPDRAGVVASLDPIDGPARTAMTDATARARRRLADLPTDPTAVEAEGRAALSQAARRYQAGQRCTDDEAGWLTVLLTIIAVRDHAWLTTKHEPWQVDLWRDLTRRAEPDLVAAPASLLALAAWMSGDGGLANIALDRALASDPRYRMALLIGQALRAGVPPSALNGWQDDAGPQ